MLLITFASTISHFLEIEFSVEIFWARARSEAQLNCWSTVHPHVDVKMRILNSGVINTLSALKWNHFVSSLITIISSRPRSRVVSSSVASFRACWLFVDLSKRLLGQWGQEFNRKRGENEQTTLTCWIIEFELTICCHSFSVSVCPSICFCRS